MIRMEIHAKPDLGIQIAHWFRQNFGSLGGKVTSATHGVVEVTLPENQKACFAAGFESLMAAMMTP